MTSFNVHTAGLQCPTCGEPIEVLSPTNETDVGLSPCGHTAVARELFE